MDYKRYSGFGPADIEEDTRHIDDIPEYFYCPELSDKPYSYNQTTTYTTAPRDPLIPKHTQDKTNEISKTPEWKFNHVVDAKHAHSNFTDEKYTGKDDYVDTEVGEIVPVNKFTTDKEKIKNLEKKVIYYTEEANNWRQKYLHQVRYTNYCLANVYHRLKGPMSTLGRLFDELETPETYDPQGGKRKHLQRETNRVTRRNSPYKM